MTGLNLRLLVLIAIATIFTSAPLFAQDDSLANEAEEPRRYTVEMIVFKYNENVSVGTEVLLPDALPQPEEVDVFGDDVRPIEAGPEAAISEPLDARFGARQRHYELVMLSGDQLTMSETWGHLQRLDVYEPVMHFGWTQATLPAEETESRPLSSFATPPRGLDGELKLYLGRYLHLVVDLALATPSSLNATYDPRSTEMSDRVLYRIQEDRIFKNGEIRYFDHPKFGVLAKITRVEKKEPEGGLEEMLGDPQLLGFQRQ